MHSKSTRFSLINLSYREEMKTKLQQLNLIRHTTNVMIAQLDLHSNKNIKRKSNYSNIKKKTPLLRLSIQEKLFSNPSTPNTVFKKKGKFLHVFIIL